MTNNYAFRGNYSFNNKCLEKNSKLLLTNNKLAVEISHGDTEEKISKYIKSEIFNFGLDLFFGSVGQNLEVIENLKNTAYRESENSGISIPLSIYLKLSPRLQYTGRFKRNKKGVNLKLHREVVLTTNREYASGSCHSFIYVNAKFLMGDVRKCDIICLGKYIQLQVVETNSEHVTCKVIVPGLVTSRMRVRFPEYIEKSHLKVSAEELEDITFAIGTNINVIMSHTPVDVDYCNELRNTLADLKCNSFYLFTRLTLSCLDNLEDAEWISGAYDGFLIDCSNQVLPDDKIMKLSPGAQAFMEKSYRKRKPIFLQGCWSNFIDPSDYHYAFQYPDKFILPCDPKFLRLFEAIFHKISQTNFLKNNIHTKTLSLASSLARSIASASFDFQADAIIISSTIGEMATRISHFRPKAVILAITSLSSVVNYSSMHHNIWMLSFDMKEKTELSHKEETHKKLVYGLRYALLKKLVDRISGTVILVFRQHIRYGSTDRFAVIQIDSSDYVETIKNVILN